MISAIEKDIIKEFGEGVIRSGSSVIDSELLVVPISPALDLVLGGGIPEGSFVTFTGHPKCGKTTTSLHFAAKCQRPENSGELCPDGREVFFFNIEGRLKKRDLEAISGLDLDRFHVIGSEPGKILTAEDFLSIAEKTINNVPGSVVILDSYSALCTEAEITSSMNKMQRADGAKLLAKFCRKIANVVPVNKNIVIGITHLMGNPTGYGAEFKEKSGQAVAYQVDVKLRAKRFSPWEISGTQIGQTVEWQVVTSALGPPGGKITSYLRYGQGLDECTELVILGSDLGLITKAGAWYKFDFVESDDKPKFQGAENCRIELQKNEELKKRLISSMHEMLGI
jgi:recombination protein RecA|tara:strand:+ start:2641 stop:3657 length:1017 start_codon:yes stop_codon:yes gene_type:complete